MPPGAFEAFYQSELQHLWTLAVVPALFVAYLAAGGFRRGKTSERPDSRFVAGFALVFGILALLDPIATGPLTGWLLLDSGAATALMLCFVLLGDLRVFVLLFGLAGIRRGFLLRAVAASLLVPLVDLVLFFGIVRSLVPDAPETILWLIHEVAFLTFALALRAAWLPERAAPEPAGHRGFLDRVLLYVAGYYALWATADVMIMAGLDTGWLVRVLANQLYYCFFVPFVYFGFFRPRA